MNVVDPRRALGGFLRAHRERMAPSAADSGRRRTPGLRREELAASSGLSVSLIAWLEQGRDVSASAQALSRLAKALNLTSAERAYLFELAGKHDPSGASAGAQTLPPPILALPETLTIPAYLLDDAWVALAWNAAAADLFKGWLDSTHDRNLMRFVFLSPAAGNLIVDLDERARRLVAEFRADVSRRLNKPSVQSLIDELTDKSPAFSKLWHAQAVVGREGGERRFKNPDRCYYQATLTLASHPHVKLVALTPMTSWAAPLF